MQTNIAQFRTMVETGMQGVRDRVTVIWQGLPSWFNTLWSDVHTAVNTWVGRIRNVMQPVVGGSGGVTMNIQPGGGIQTQAQHGGRIREPGLVEVGERGREIVHLPRGATIAPLPVGQQLDTQGERGQIVLQQYITAQARPEDLQRYTERALRKLAVEWNIR